MGLIIPKDHGSALDSVQNAGGDKKVKDFFKRYLEIVPDLTRVSALIFVDATNRMDNERRVSFELAERNKPWELFFVSSATMFLVFFHHRPTVCPSYTNGTVDYESTVPNHFF